MLVSLVHAGETGLVDRPRSWERPLGFKQGLGDNLDAAMVVLENAGSIYPTLPRRAGVEIEVLVRQDSVGQGCEGRMGGLAELDSVVVPW